MKKAKIDELVRKILREEMTKKEVFDVLYENLGGVHPANRAIKESKQRLINDWVWEQMKEQA